MTTFRAIMVPLAVLCIGIGMLAGGKLGHLLIIAGTVLAGVAVVLVMVET